MFQFVPQWLTFHPNFAGNPLYIGGDSYSGIVAPILIKDILHGNSLFKAQHMLLKDFFFQLELEPFHN